MKKTQPILPLIDTFLYPPLLEEDEEAAALLDILEDDGSEEDNIDKEDRFFTPPLSQRHTFFIPTLSEYDDIHIASFGDALKIRHNFVMLMHLMASETEKPDSEQRFIDFTEDKNTHLNNKRIDFQLRGTDNHFYPAYCYRSQKNIVYGLSQETMTTITDRKHALPALIHLAKADIHVLTQLVKKPQPPFEVDTTLKDPLFIQEILQLLNIK